MGARTRSYVVVLAAAAGAGLAAVVWLSAGQAPERTPRAFVPPATEEPITPIPDALPLDARKVALGRRLFHDQRLSRDGSVSCADCHLLTKAGTDGARLSSGVQGRLGAVNSPSVFNTAFNFRQFWDGRAATLEEQVDGPLHNPVEMDSDWPRAIASLARDEAYVREFEAIWPDGIQPAHVRAAIAEFERGLITPDAPFDRYLKGDEHALSAAARKGWDLFRNLGCIACHQGVNLGGNMYASLGIMGDYFAARGAPITRSDLGRFNVTGRENDRHVFKVPGLRNVAQTAPYFHDGAVSSLEGAVAKMARYQLGVGLTDTDRRALVAFLQSLSGRPPEPAP